MGFKEDADFARFVSMGAIATDVVRRDMAKQGHHLIELERYAMANKIWQTKVKRLRLPDLLCINCGIRIESRAKSKLGIILSHSDARDRGWDAGGMRSSDLYAFLRVELSGSSPRIGPPSYFRTEDLRRSRSSAKESNRKAISEGAEVTLTWPSWVPARSGTVIGVDTQDRLVCAWSSGGQYRYGHWSRWAAQYQYVPDGGVVSANETIVAGVVAPAGDLSCGGGWQVRDGLVGDDDGERYAAVRGAGALQMTNLTSELIDIASNAADWRVSLEAASSLARMDHSWTRWIVDLALDHGRAPESRMESVFVLSEIPTDEASDALERVADQAGSAVPEVRAAAVWGLARGVRPRPERVLRFAVDDDDLIALHAISGLASLPDSLISDLSEWLSSCEDRRAAAAAQILMRHEAVEPLLRAVHCGGRARLWAVRALGDMSPDHVRAQGGELLTPDVERDLEPLWLSRNDWLRGSGAEGLEALDIQTVRFDPFWA